MSIDLILEVMDHAPADLTSGERLALIVIAERANDKTRIATQSTRWTLDTIAHRTGVKRTGLKSIFQGLARKGCEVRVPVKVTPDGKPVFAFEGTAVTFKVPRLAKRGGQGIPSDERGRQDTPTGVGVGMPQHPRGEAVASKRGGQSHPQTLMPLREPSNPSPLPPVSRTAPSGASVPEEGAGSFDQNPNPYREQAAHLAEPYAARIRNGQLADLEAQLAAALDRGWTTSALERELAARHDGLNDLGAGLIARIRNLKQPPARPAPPAEPLPGEGERCPLPYHRDLVRNCGLCWGDVKAGQDPYAKHEDLRPGWWHEVYRRPTRKSRQETRG